MTAPPASRRARPRGSPVRLAQSIATCGRPKRAPCGWWRRRRCDAGGGGLHTRPAFGDAGCAARELGARVWRAGGIGAWLAQRGPRPRRARMVPGRSQPMQSPATEQRCFLQNLAPAVPLVPPPLSSGLNCPRRRPARRAFFSYGPLTKNCACGVPRGRSLCARMIRPSPQLLGGASQSPRPP